ncbi:MAG: HDOD domain-containing protein [Gammaproteobacteria bacterium]|nr:HDOD domain-containing protein [Gammaproteobacteria bacterium]
MSAKAETLFQDLKHAVETDRLILPTLPDVALKIRDAVESENSTAQDISDALAQDASLATRLIKVANSPLYRTRNPIEDLQMAVTRLGIRIVRDLVVGLAMKQIFQATSNALDVHSRNIWHKSVDAAAISRMMATLVSGVNPERALLAGLIHNIGALPVLILAENDDELFHDEEALGRVIYELQGEVGELILRHWEFDEDMIEVVKQCLNFTYQSEAQESIVDLVQVALLQGKHVPTEITPENWAEVPAFTRLGLDIEVNVVDIEENKEMIENTKQALK